MFYLCLAFIFVGMGGLVLPSCLLPGQVPSTKLGNIQIYLSTNFVSSICQLSVEHLNLTSQLQHILPNSSSHCAGWQSTLVIAYSS
jgi:hypothetical protein